MNLREMVETGTKITGEQQNLAKVIGVHPDVLSAAKAGRRGLPAEACSKLADLLQIDYRKVIAASQLVTEKDEKKREYWLPFVLNGAAPLVAAISAAILTTASTDSKAADTLEVSAAAVEPASISQINEQDNVYYVT